MNEDKVFTFLREDICDPLRQKKILQHIAGSNDLAMSYALFQAFSEAKPDERAGACPYPEHGPL
jgi:hypothetical protein